MVRERKQAAGKTSRGKSFLDKDRYTAELTSGQLVFGISILLVFGLTCFLLGILVGRFEPAQTQLASAAPNEEVTAEPVLSPDPAPSEAPARENRRRTVTVEPAKPNGVREDIAPAENETAAETPTAQPTPASEGPRDLSGPRPVAFPESGVNSGATSDPPAEAPAPEEAPAAEEPAPSSETERITIAKAEPSTQPEAQKPAVIIDTPLDVEPEAPAKPSTPEPPAEERVEMARAPEATIEALEPPAETVQPERPVESGRYSIQVAAMSKVENADALKKQFEAQLSHSVRVERIPARQLSLVLIGAFPSRGEAQRALTDFRARFPKFADAFIRTEN